MNDKIKPRAPGLWKCRTRGDGVDHGAEVESAEAHLLQLLEDPYYMEAFHRVKKRIDPVRLHMAIGALAKKHQEPEPPKRERGAPEVPREWATLFLLKMGGKPPTIGQCRKLAKSFCPTASDPNREAMAKHLLQTLKNHKKKLKKTTG